MEVIQEMLKTYVFFIKFLDHITIKNGLWEKKNRKEIVWDSKDCLHCLLITVYIMDECMSFNGFIMWES
jgi:hypothetical protein